MRRQPHIDLLGTVPRNIYQHAFNSFETYNVGEIHKIILSNPMKSCSLDPIPGSILKEILPEILPFITTMCNRSLEEGWLPESQRHATLKPILKKDGLDAKDVKSYRPISNLTFISKLVERLVNLQLTEFLEKHGPNTNLAFVHAIQQKLHSRKLCLTSWHRLTREILRFLGCSTYLLRLTRLTTIFCSIVLKCLMD